MERQRQADVVIRSTLLVIHVIRTLIITAMTVQYRQIYLHLKDVYGSLKILNCVSCFGTYICSFKEKKREKKKDRQGVNIFYISFSGLRRPFCRHIGGNVYYVFVKMEIYLNENVYI